MSLNEEMTTLADTVRATIHYGVDCNQSNTLLGLSDMVYRLNNFILRTNVPVFTNSDSTFVTKPQGGKQVFDSTKPTNINTSVYPNNYSEDIFVVSKNGTRFEQEITIETDGNVNLTNTKIAFYLGSNDSHKEVDCQDIVKLRDNVYRLSTNGIVTKENLIFEPFNIILDISNCTYIKFSELSFNIIEPSVMGGELTKPNLIADWANSSIDDSRASLSDGILSFNEPNGGKVSADFLVIYKRIKLTPGHTYQLSYRVRGNGYVRTYIYAYTDKETQAYVDNLNIIQLEDSWQTVTYTFKYNPAGNSPLSFSFRAGRSDDDISASSKGEASNFCLVDISQ